MRILTPQGDGHMPDHRPPVRQWRIHLGAHKTATTHIQEVLARKRDELIVNGLDFIPHSVVRKLGLAHALRKRSLRARMPVLRDGIAAEILCRTVDPLRKGPDTVVLSEENLIGALPTMYVDRLYPTADTCITRLRGLRRRSDVVFFLSIRSFDAQIPASYAQGLRHKPPLKGGFEAIRRRMLASPPSWLDLVRRICRLAPDVPLVVWRHEDYRTHAEEILAMLCGRPIGPLPQVEDPPETRTPSAEGVRAAEGLSDDLPAHERRSIVGEIYRETFEGRRFSPFTREETRELRAHYEADLAGIAALDGVTLLRFN